MRKFSVAAVTCAMMVWMPGPRSREPEATVTRPPGSNCTSTDAAERLAAAAWASEGASAVVNTTVAVPFMKSRRDIGQS